MRSWRFAKDLNRCHGKLPTPLSGHKSGRRGSALVALLLCGVLLFAGGCSSSQMEEVSDGEETVSAESKRATATHQSAIDRLEIWTGTSLDLLDWVEVLGEISDYSGDLYVVIGDNLPDFTQEQLSSLTAYESYGSLDELGRCTACIACIGQELMPTEARGAIGQIKPTGWHTVKYDSVDGLYLYNRCHLIAYELTAENANEANLITGTRYFNTQGMLPLENMVTDYIKDTGNHVLYRVTPIFAGDNLVATGVQMEAYSLEDDGEAICYNLFVYNIQPGIAIDYATGESWEVEEEETESEVADTDTVTYVVNNNTKKFHSSDCASAEEISSYNRSEYTGSRDTLISQGYTPCQRCNP